MHRISLHLSHLVRLILIRYMFLHNFFFPFYHLWPNHLHTGSTCSLFDSFLIFFLILFNCKLGVTLICRNASGLMWIVYSLYCWTRTTTSPRTCFTHMLYVTLNTLETFWIGCWTCVSDPDGIILSKTLPFSNPEEPYHPSQRVLIETNTITLCDKKLLFFKSKFFSWFFLVF